MEVGKEITKKEVISLVKELSNEIKEISAYQTLLEDIDNLECRINLAISFIEENNLSKNKNGFEYGLTSFDTNQLLKILKE